MNTLSEQQSEQQPSEYLLIKEKTSRKDNTNINTATINTLRQALIDFSECYAFSDQLDMEKYGDVYNNVFELNLSVADRSCVLNSSISILFLSHRISRLPIMWSDETDDLLALNENGKSQLHFIVCKGFQTDNPSYNKPYIHEDDEPLSLYSRDLRGVWVTETDDGLDAKLLSPEETEVLFPYNVLIARIQKGEKMHMVTTPERDILYVYGQTKENQSRFRPCCWIYRNIPPQKHEAIKIPGRNYKDKSTEINLAGNIQQQYTVDEFGNPEEIEYMISYNGKRWPADALDSSVKEVVSILRLFNNHYQNQDPEYLGYTRVNSGVEGDKDQETIYVPKNDIVLSTDDELHKKFRGFATPMICDLIASRLLERVVGLIKSYQSPTGNAQQTAQDQMYMVTHTLIAAKNLIR